MIRRPPESTLIDTLFPDTTLFDLVDLRHAADDLGSDRHLPAVARDPVAEAVQEQRAPVLLSGDPVLIRRDLLKTRDVLAIMQKRAHLGEDLRPAILELLEERVMLGVTDRSIRHQSLARSEERRVGKEWVSPCKCRGLPEH